MPRTSSRHNKYSSKHSCSSKDNNNRDYYSDSERDSSLKENNSKKSNNNNNKDDNTITSSIRVSKERTLDLEEQYAVLEEYNNTSSSSSKRRKERSEHDGGGGGIKDRWNVEDEHFQGLKKSSKVSIESKSKRRDDVEVEDGRKSSGKSRKEGRERDRDKDRESGGGGSEREREREREKKTKDGKTDRLGNGQLNEISESMVIRHQLLAAVESDNQLERRAKRKKDESGDPDKLHDDMADLSDLRSSSRDDFPKDGKSKTDKHKSEKHRDKYRDDADRNIRHRDDKQRDDRWTRDHSNGKSDNKPPRDEKDAIEVRQKKSKVTEDRELDRTRDRDFDNDRDLDLDESRFEERSRGDKDSNAKRKSPDDRSDYDDAKYKGSKAPPEVAKKSASISKVESETDRGRARSHQVQVEIKVSGSSRRRASPSSSSHGAIDDYRHVKQEDTKYRDTVTEQKHRGNPSREATGFSGASDRGSKYRSSEKPIKMDDDLPIEKSTSAIASPRTLKERSPSATSYERKYMNRPGNRRSLDADEAGWRSGASGGPREKSTDRFSREPPMDDRTGQSNSINRPPSYRGGVSSSSSFMINPMEEDSRSNTNSGYKRDGDPHNRRRQGTAWRPPPNWSPALPNGFIYAAPPHAGFQSMMAPFPSPLYGMRPSIDINQSGLPYHIPEADRFPSHLRPLGWQGSTPSNLHGWDGSNYGATEWDPNRHPMHARGWEPNPDMWKGQNGDNMLTKSQKEDHSDQQPVDEVENVQASQRSQNDDNHFGIRTVDSSPKSLLQTPKEEKSDPFKSEDDNSAQHCCTYLSKLDISSELAGPELYDQCMSLLGKEERATSDGDSNVIINLKDGGRAIPKSSITSLIPSLLPAANDFVFQKAMNHYKKQREENGGFRIFKCKTLDMILSPNQDMVDQIADVESTEVAPSVKVEMTDTTDVVVPYVDVEMTDTAEVPASDQNEAKTEELELSMNSIINEDESKELDPSMSNETRTPIKGDDFFISDENERETFGEDSISEPLVLSEGSPKKAPEPTIIAIESESLYAALRVAGHICSVLVYSAIFMNSTKQYKHFSKIDKNDALAEWLRRVPAKYMGFPRESSNLSGVTASRSSGPVPTNKIDNDHIGEKVNLGNARTSSASSKEIDECAQVLVGLATCLAYVGGDAKAKAPTPDCCNGLKQVMNTNKKCLCVVVRDRNDPDLGLNINATLALGLPSVCHVPADVSKCPALLHMDPNSSEAQVFYQFSHTATSPAPTPTGGSSISSSSKGTSSVQQQSSAGAGAGAGGIKRLMGLEFAAVLILFA
ncbi:hypothetical protein ACFE04_008986 [Oxalis oulophora]